MYSRAILVLTALVAIQPRPVAAQSDKLYFDPCPAFADDMTFDCYHSYPEIQAFLEDAARRYPDHATLESMGRSWEGRDLWVMTITDPAGGPAEEKPAIWVDGGIDSDEVVAIEAALGLVHRLLTSDDPETRELRQSRTFYIAPSVAPDASQLHHTTPIRPRDTTLRPWDDDNDGVADEDGPDDLDGDGQALQMIVEDPTGEYVRSAADPRILRERRVGDEGPFYARYAEGLDDDDDGEYNEDPPGGVDPNRNYPGNWSLAQGGNGPFPGSEPELRVMLDFILDHPNIAASQHFHSSGGVVLRPPSVPDLELPPEDQALYLDLSRRGLEVSGYDLATSVYDWNWPRDSANRKQGQVWRDDEGRIRGAGEDAFGDPAEPAGATAYPAFGGSIDALYLLFGIVAFANEIYQMGEDTDGDGRVEMAEQLSHNDEVQGGYAFREWTPYQHPQLGPVEIGGWRKFGHNNPPPAELPEEVRRNVDFVLMQARNTQLLSLPKPRVEALGGDVYRVTAVVRNTGRVPTELEIRRRNDRAVPVRVRLDGAEVLNARPVQELGVIGGYAEKEAEWVVRAPAGGALTIEARHPKAGVARRTVRLDG